MRFRVSAFEPPVGLCGICVQIHGGDKIAPAITYVFLSNHQGNLDGPVLLHAIPRDWKALIKKEMMKLPVLVAGSETSSIRSDRAVESQESPNRDRPWNSAAGKGPFFRGLSGGHAKQERPLGGV